MILHPSSHGQHKPVSIIRTEFLHSSLLILKDRRLGKRNTPSKQHSNLTRNQMIKKTPKGYKVTSEKGKPLSKSNLTKAQAEHRLAQVEMFKHMKGNTKRLTTAKSC